MDPVRLIVVMAFDRSDEGELSPAFEAMQFEVEDRAIRTAKDMAGKHAGVIAWARRWGIRTADCFVSVRRSSGDGVDEQSRRNTNR